MTLCPVCDSAELDSHADLMACRACNHIFQHPPVISCAYDSTYLETYEAYPTSTMSHLRLGFLKAFISGGRLLDVGYGTGEFVRLACSAGFDAYGCDRHGVPCGLNEIPLATDRSKWDVVTFYDSLEHFDDLAIVRDLLQRARVVLIATPLYPDTFPINRAWRHYKPGEHLHYFSPTSLRRLVAKDILAESDVEDVIRRGSSGTQNIYTAIFNGS